MKNTYVKIKNRVKKLGGYMKKAIVKVFYFYSMLFISFLAIDDIKVYANNLDNYLSFSNITINDGLSQGSVDDIFQDKEGYMWFATNDGLNVYDGYDFKVFKGDNNDSTTIWPGLVNSIEEDDEGYLWIGTGGGLAKINKKNYEVQRIYVDKKDSTKITNQNVLEIMKDSKGNMWIATDDGLNKYDYKTKGFKKYLFDNENPKEDKKKTIIALAEDSNGKIIVGFKDDGLREVDQLTEKFIAYDNKEENLLKNKYITDIYKDIKNNLWISTKSGEVYKYNISNKKMDLESQINKEFSENNLFVKTIGDDLEGNIWFGTGAGLYKYYDENNTYFKYTNNPYNLRSLVSNSVSEIYRDKSGLIWIGTLSGISKINIQQNFVNYQKSFGDENSLSGKSISGIYEDEFENLWIGTNIEGLNKLDRKNDTYTHYKYKEEENSIASNNIWQVTGDGKGNLWVATKEGLSKIEIETNKITNYTHNPNDENSISDNDVREVFVDNHGYLWIGTRNGLDLYDPKEDKFINLNKVILDSGLNELFVRRVFQDFKGDYWLAVGWHSGLLKIDVENKKTKLYNHNLNSTECLSDNMVMDINQGLDGAIWVATTNGLNRINTKSNEIKVYKEKDGIGNSYIYGILIDDKGNLWLSTNGGLSNFDVLDEKFDNYTYMDGLLSNEFNVLSKFKSKTGEMFFGGVEGVSSFIPKNISRGDLVLGNVTIRDIHVYNNDKIKYAENLNLNYGENHFTINFILPEYRDAKSVSYEYKLDGFDKEWINSGNRRDAIYTNVPPGRYNFKVRARLKNGIYSRENNFNININKPWYFSNVAIIIYFGIVALIILIAINYVKILDSLVKQKTIQLNAEIIEKDKIYEEKENLYEELLRYEKFRNTYLVNLSHELRTPLNVILSSEQLITSLNKSEEGIEKNRLDKYMKIIKSNSKNLLEVINDLIDSSKIKSGAYNITFEKNDIVYLVEEVALSMKTYIEQEGLELIIDPEIEEKIIDCSKKEVERIIINLISNAVKFTEQGTIYIGLKEVGNFVEITVKDSGKGIAKDYQSIIFDRFTQIEDGVSSKHCSSGIGLNLVKDFVELHGGSITLISELGKGSEFIIRLPVNNEKN